MVSALHRSWAYILASQPRGTLYIGVTNDILGRVEVHRAGKGSSFTARYGVTRLVWFEEFDRVEEAIQREKSLKRTSKSLTRNGVDLYPGLASRHDFSGSASFAVGPRDKPEDDIL